MAQHIFTGTTPPTIIPTKVGQHYIDTASKNSYISVGTTSTLDWVINNVDFDLSEIAAIEPNNDDIIQQVSGTWTNVSPGEYKFSLALDEVDNTSDLNKPISIATQATIDFKLDANSPIVSGTATKITFDKDGLVTAGAAATTADIPDSFNRRYITDAVLNALSDTVNTVTGVTAQTVIDFIPAVESNSVIWNVEVDQENDPSKYYSSSIYAIVNNDFSLVNHTETAIITNNIAGLEFNVNYDLGNIQLLASGTDSVTIKTIRRTI